jgi:hypothetical protein
VVQVARCYDRHLLEFGDRIFIRQACRGMVPSKQSRQFLVVEADEAEIEIFVLKRSQLETLEFFIPASVERQLVVGENVGTFLALAEVIKDDDRHFSDLQLAGREQPAVVAGGSVG